MDMLFIFLNEDCFIIFFRILNIIEIFKLNISITILSYIKQKTALSKCIKRYTKKVLLEEIY